MFVQAGFEYTLPVKMHAKITTHICKLSRSCHTQTCHLIAPPSEVLLPILLLIVRFEFDNCASALTISIPTTKDGHRRHQHILSLQDVGNVHFLSVAVSLQSQTKTKRPSHQQSIYFSVCLSMAEPGGRNASRFLSRMMLWPSVRLRNRGAFLCLDLRQPPTDM